MSIQRFEMSKEQIIMLHDLMISAFNGVNDTLEPGSLDKVMDLYNQPYTGRQILAKASALLFGIIRYHPFLDANKRTAILVVTTFLNMNNFDFECTEAQCYDIVEKIEKGYLSREELKEQIFGIVIPRV